MLLLVTLTAAVAVAGFFDVEQVNEIRLEFAEPNWDEILDSLYAAGQEGRLIGTAVINGRRFDSVGVRYKGQSSYNPSRRKNPFNIRLDEVRSGQNIEGHGTLRLANVFKDPSFVREVLSYEICRRYMPAGRANFTNIYVNDTLIGLYTNCEDVDKRFMRTFFYCDENARFKGRIGDSARMTGWKYLGPDSTPYQAYYELESDSGWRELIGFLDTLNNRNQALEQVLDVDQHLWMLAFDILFVNLDAPINMPQNFYLYRDAAHRFRPMVWDLNECFGAFRDLHGIGILTVPQMQQLDPFLRSGDTNYPIASQVLPVPRWRRMFVAHMKTIIAEVLSGGWYHDRALEIQDVADAHVRADPNKFYTYNDFLNNVTRSVGTGPLAIVGLTELMSARASFVLSRPEFQAAAPVVSGLEVEPACPAPNSPVVFRARVEGADSVFLGFRQSPAHGFERLPMPDAGNGAFATTVVVSGGTAEYYLYAENGEAGVFRPARAERESFGLPVAGSVVINEFMADNVSTVPDPSGQFDDWIELYNNSPSSVSLDEYLLSDDSTDPGKWWFPDVAIPAGGYLIVWADNDQSQPGLHASFRLNKEGDQLVLSDPDGRRLDLVVFGPQTADISCGRYPNGTGAFRRMNPTFAAENDSGVGLAESAGWTGIRRLEGAFPNPFARQTVLRYTLASAGRVSLRVYDRAGRLAAVLADAEQAAGAHRVEFPGPGHELPEGIYFVRLAVQAGDRRCAIESTKLVLTK